MTLPDTLTHPLANPMRQITIEVPPAVALKLSEWHEGPLEHAALAALRLYHGLGPAAHAQLLQAAKTLDTTPAKALRTAVERLVEQANKIRPTAARGRPAINQERDTAIFLRIMEGATYAEVAHAFNLSIVRVGQVVAQQRAMRGMESHRAQQTRNIKWPGGKPPEQHDARTGLADVLLRMDVAGLSRKDAATATGLTPEQIDRAYAAYTAALPSDPTKGDRVSATFAGLHALENKPQDTPKDEEVLSLEVSNPEPPRKLVIIPPSMRNQMNQTDPHATPTAHTPPAPEQTLQELQQEFDNLMGGL
jgi:hypothetical protein